MASVSGYRWRGWTARHETIRQWADAWWEHDQRRNGQLNRQRNGVTPEAASPAAGVTPSAHPTHHPAANGGPTP